MAICCHSVDALIGRYQSKVYETNSLQTSNPKIEDLVSILSYSTLRDSESVQFSFLDRNKGKKTPSVIVLFRCIVFFSG